MTSPVFFNVLGCAFATFLGLGCPQFRLNFGFLTFQTFQNSLHVGTADLAFLRHFTFQKVA